MNEPDPSDARTRATTVAGTDGAPAHRTAALGGGLVVAAIFLAITLGALDQFVVLTALPNIATSLSASGGVAFVVSAYLIAAAVGILVFGRLTQMFRHRDVLLVGLLTFIVGSALAGVSQNLTELIAFRSLQGFSADCFVVVGYAIVADLFTPEVRARLTGLFTGSFVIATIAGPFLGSFIVDHASWRWVFYVNIPVAGVAALIAALALGGAAVRVRSRFDFPGTALLAGWVSALTFALVQTSEGGWAWTDPRVLGSLVAGFALLLGFVLWERRASDPLVPRSLFRSSTVTASSAVSFFRGIALFSVYTFVAIYVGLVLLKGGSAAADDVRDVLYFLVVPAVFGAAVGSQVLTRVSYRPIMLGGLGLALLGALLLTQISATTPLWSLELGFLPVGGLALPLIPIGLGAGLTFPATLLAAQFAVSKEETGLATSMVEFTQTIGGAMGVSALTSFQEWRVGSLNSLPASSCVSPASCGAYATSLQQATVTALQETFALVAVIVAVALLASWWMEGRMPTSTGAVDPATGSTEPEPFGLNPEA